MKTGSKWAKLGLVLGMFLACGKIDGGGSSETNWLGSCTDDADCAEGVACLCGVCSRRCSSGSDCSGVGSSSACVAAASVGACAEQPEVPSLCLAVCGDDTDCGGGFSCRDGACQPSAVPSPPIDGGSAGATGDAGSAGATGDPVGRCDGAPGACFGPDTAVNNVDSSAGCPCTGDAVVCTTDCDGQPLALVCLRRGFVDPHWTAIDHRYCADPTAEVCTIEPADSPMYLEPGSPAECDACIPIGDPGGTPECVDPNLLCTYEGGFLGASCQCSTAGWGCAL